VNKVALPGHPPTGLRQVEDPDEPSTWQNLVHRQRCEQARPIEGLRPIMANSLAGRHVAFLATHGVERSSWSCRGAGC
jgi:hypothetical protein